MMLKNILLSVIRYCCYHGYFKWLSDESYVKLLYYGTFGKCINLDNPKDYNEKLQWIKLHVIGSEYQNLVDKVEAKKYVAKIIGEKYIIPTYGVWTKFDDIDFDKLPNKFVLKTTHGSGGVVVCTNKAELDLEETRDVINKSLMRNQYELCRERPYKNIPPRIIAEQYIAPPGVNCIDDYKMLCFNGRFDNVMVCEGRKSDRGVRFYHFDKDWNFLPYVQYDDFGQIDFNSLRPKNYDEMISVAEKLSKAFLHVRVDLYNVEGKIYFGELTFFQSGGFDDDYTVEAKHILGNKITIPV